MPEHRACISCGKVVYHVASSARGGSICRDCRTRLCRQCRQPYLGRDWSVFCSSTCNRAYWAAFYERQEAS